MQTECAKYDGVCYAAVESCLFVRPANVGLRKDCLLNYLKLYRGAGSWPGHLACTGVELVTRDLYLRHPGMDFILLNSKLSIPPLWTVNHLLWYSI
jgi:hypothetical protein